eukprot:1546816-Heterocapsa_arctica.AAC.1
MDRGGGKAYGNLSGVKCKLDGGFQGQAFDPGQCQNATQAADSKASERGRAGKGRTVGRWVG